MTRTSSIGVKKPLAANLAFDGGADADSEHCTAISITTMMSHQPRTKRTIKPTEKGASYFGSLMPVAPSSLSSHSLSTLPAGARHAHQHRHQAAGVNKIDDHADVVHAGDRRRRKRPQARATAVSIVTSTAVILDDVANDEGRPAEVKCSMGSTQERLLDTNDGRRSSSGETSETRLPDQSLFNLDQPNCQLITDSPTRARKKEELAAGDGTDAFGIGNTAKSQHGLMDQLPPCEDLSLDNPSSTDYEQYVPIDKDEGDQFIPEIVISSEASLEGQEKAFHPAAGEAENPLMVKVHHREPNNNVDSPGSNCEVVSGRISIALCSDTLVRDEESPNSGGHGHPNTGAIMNQHSRAGRSDDESDNKQLLWSSSGNPPASAVTTPTSSILSRLVCSETLGDDFDHIRHQQQQQQPVPKKPRCNNTAPSKERRRLLPKTTVDQSTQLHQQNPATPPGFIITRPQLKNGTISDKNVGNLTYLLSAAKPHVLLQNSARQINVKPTENGAIGGTPVADVHTKSTNTAVSKRKKGPPAGRKSATKVPPMSKGRGSKAGSVQRPAASSGGSSTRQLLPVASEHELTYSKLTLQQVQAERSLQNVTASSFGCHFLAGDVADQHSPAWGASTTPSSSSRLHHHQPGQQAASSSAEKRAVDTRWAVSEAAGSRLKLSRTTLNALPPVVTAAGLAATTSAPIHRRLSNVSAAADESPTSWSLVSIRKVVQPSTAPNRTSAAVTASGGEAYRVPQGTTLTPISAPSNGLSIPKKKAMPGLKRLSPALLDEEAESHQPAAKSVLADPAGRLLPKVPLLKEPATRILHVLGFDVIKPRSSSVVQSGDTRSSPAGKNATAVAAESESFVDPINSAVAVYRKSVDGGYIRITWRDALNIPTPEIDRTCALGCESIRLRPEKISS